MRAPDKAMLQRCTVGGVSYALCLHPNPRFYKHHWQVFTKDSPWEGEEFMQRSPRLSTAACMQRLAELELTGEPYVLYGGKRPRRFDGMPFDPKVARWQGADWAPPLEDDSDPEWNGHR